MEKGRYFEYIFSLSQTKMKQLAAKELTKYFSEDKIVETKDYIYAIGDIPIALIAHLDTVWEDSPPKYTFFDPFKNVMWAPNGLGADDRAGVLAIFEILGTGLRPSVIFTTNEEIGGLGAEALASNPCPFEDLHYMIELDRRGKNDCVFYDCESKPFQKYIESFGFDTAIGSFSDISMLCGSWEICGVNLSIGYYNEHTPREILFLNSMYTTISRVIKMLKVKEIPEFVWEGVSYIPHFTDWYNFLKKTPPEHTACKHCLKHLVDQEGVGAMTEHGGIAYYCFDCMPHFVSYCPRCGEPFENSEGIASDKFCPDCRIIMGGDTYDTFKF